MESRTAYLVVALVAALVAAWLALQVIGFLLKLVLLSGAIVVAVAAFRSWQRAGDDGRSTGAR
jgi:hypothetical protein